MGSGTKIARSRLQAGLKTLLLTKRLSGIVDYDCDNLSITVGAGMKLSQVRDVLGENNQRLPLDPFLSERSTIGGIVASASSGPLRYKYGSVRDLVLGLRVVLPTEEAIKCGGKVVKNVAGYDMPKLFIGSYGTLGVITEVTFRLYPLPETESTVLFLSRGFAAASAMVQSLLSSPLEPSAIEILNPSALCVVGEQAGLAPSCRYCVAVRFEGFREAVKRQIDDAFSMWRGLGGQEEAIVKGDAGFWSSLSLLPSTAKYVASFKAGLPMSLVKDAFSKIEEASGKTGCALCLVSHAGSGIIHGFVDCPLENEGSLYGFARAAASHVRSLGGYISSLDAPPGAGLSTPPNPGVLSLMKRVKDAFDPNGVIPFLDCLLFPSA
jgi:glycolate oxidase FAD binding subunit